MEADSLVSGPSCSQGSRLRANRPRRFGRATLAVTVVVVLHVGLLAFIAWRHSPVDTEAAHLAAGLRHLHLGQFDLYRVNPPLVRMVAALPVLAAAPHTNWRGTSPNPLERRELLVGEDFLVANGRRSFWLVTLARWACLPFSVVGALVSYRWAQRLYGEAAGSAALVLWCFSPWILGHAPLVLPNAQAAAMATAAAYAFWCWLRQPDWLRAGIAGVVLGLAELTKMSLLVFLPLWPLVWIAYRLGKPAAAGQTRLVHQGGQERFRHRRVPDI